MKEKKESIFIPFFLILILFPLLGIALSLYVMTIYSYVFDNDLDATSLLGTVVALIFLTFFLLLLITKIDKRSVLFKELEYRLLSYHSLIIIFYLFIFGCFLFVKTVFIKQEILHTLISVIIFIFTSFAYYECVFKSTNEKLKLVNVTKDEYGIIELTFASNDEVYIKYTNSNVYIKDKTYICKVNKLLKKVKKIKEISEDKEGNY